MTFAQAANIYMEQKDLGSSLSTAYKIQLEEAAKNHLNPNVNGKSSLYIYYENIDGTKNTTPFLDLDALVIDIPAGDERGLLGLTFHPDFLSNGYFYVNYINNSGNTVISRFSVSTNPEIADDSSELIILTYSQPYIAHKGGDMHFGVDGYLYISSGDGGSVGDPDDNSQNLSNLLGKILRIDVNNVSGGNNYDIPSDNPFISNGSAAN